MSEHQGTTRGQEIDMISLFFKHIPLGAEQSRMMMVCIRGVVVKVGRNGQILDIIQKQNTAASDTGLEVEVREREELQVFAGAADSGAFFVGRK